MTERTAPPRSDHPAHNLTDRTVHAMSDAALVRCAAAGLTEAFDELVRRYRPLLHHLARGWARDPRDAEELVQDTLVKMWSGLPSFRAEARVSTWLHTICRRTAIDRSRRRRLELTSLDDEPEPATDSADVETDDQLALDDVLSVLQPPHRAAVVLVDVDGYTAAEAADREGIPASTMRSRVGKARRLLADRLGGAA
ncbi:MAG: RNA polymerase sigma factor [Actinomycetota bacterium]|nr:RNA polymerase sigma factor [Actinomycetota bacterium]